MDKRIEKNETGRNETGNERFMELYESILSREESGCSYRIYSEKLNEYTAWISYKDIIFEYTVIQKPSESKIYDKWGNLMKSVIRIEGDGEEKWLSLSEWDDKARMRANRHYAENIALAKLFNRVLRESHNMWLKFNEDIWTKKEGEEDSWVKKLSYGDMAYIKKDGARFKYSCFVKKEDVEGSFTADLRGAQEGIVKLILQEAVKKMQMSCKNENDYKTWLGRKEKELYKE